ncbi:MAG: C10 family peptidase [Muribaculaceae bacterium]|nr:C10 family peptidase [Muribaculaceae bacterium]
MKNILLLSLLAAGTILPTAAVTLTPEQALTRFNSNRPKRVAATNDITANNLQLQSTLDNLYIFSSGKGFVVLPNEDSAPALLAYSDTGEFDLNSNPSIREWFDFYNRQLNFLKNHPENNKTLTVSHKNRPEISPLLKTEWNQEYPYNLLCPKVDGHETVTGCVATAMAQVMKYHNFPEHGKGTHSYFWHPGEEELSFNYDSIPFQWDKMDNIYDKESSNEARHAVAELMLGCGVSVDMHYEPGGSGAATVMMGESLIDIFGYSKSLWMPNRAYYGYEEWEDMIYADLAEGLPVLYSGAGTAGGHQFVCDGYSSDGFFHFNWGWGGLSNGYFLLTALNPDNLGVGGGAGGFNTSQIATLGVRPGKNDDKPVYIFYNTDSFFSNMKEVKEGNDFLCGGQYFNFSLATMPVGSRLGLKFLSESTDEAYFAEGPSVEGYHPDDGRNDILVRFPKLPDGSYEITPVLKVDGKWSAVRIPVGQPQMIVAVVKDGVATIENQNPASIFVTNIEMPEKIYRNHEFPMTFTVENIGDEEFYSTITPILLDSKGDVVSKSTFRPVDILLGEKEEIKDYVGKFSALKDHSFAPGTYTMVFRDEVGKNVSDPIEVDIYVNSDKTEIKVTDLDVDDKDNITDPSKIHISFKVDCESGVYFGSLRFDVFPDDGGYEICGSTSSDIYLGAGESKDAEMTADFSHLNDGWYIGAIYDGGKSMTGSIRFHIHRETDAINEIDTETVNSIIYDLNGIPQTSPSASGIFIIEGKKVIINHR